jgi:hypothetical protein
MSYVPATASRDLWVILGGPVAVGIGFLWFEHVRARRRQAAPMDAHDSPLPTGVPELDRARGLDRTEAGQEPEAPR